MELTKREKKQLKLHGDSRIRETSTTIHSQNSYKSQESGSKRSIKKYFIISAVLLIIIGIVTYSVYYYKQPGRYDEFAKCLSGREVVIYGAVEWCRYTQLQKSMFGKSFKYLNYQDYRKLDGIKKTPTWVINGKWYENVQSFDRLKELTGCSY